MYNKKVLLGCPVRNREWILPEYLKRLENLDYRKDLLSFLFIVNDSSDKSFKILQDWREKNKSKFNYILVVQENFHIPEDFGENRNKNLIRTEEHFQNLAFLRNSFLDLADMLRVDYLFSVDSDILVKPEVLKLLIKTEKDIVSALVVNGKDDNGKFVGYNFLPLSGDRTRLPEEIFNIKEGSYSYTPFEVRVNGAVILISKNVFNQYPSIKYYPCASGEDEGFNKSAGRCGFKSYVLPYMQGHVMKKEELKNVMDWI